tara:strand:+ start:218 stop:484 length:267 start_codon:yes stop_codon:yes gene_type:complete
VKSLAFRTFEALSCSEKISCLLKKANLIPPLFASTNSIADQGTISRSERLEWSGLKTYLFFPVVELLFHFVDLFGLRHVGGKQVLVAA